MNWNPNVVVFGPGGIKGLLEIGALQAIEDFRPQWIDNFEIVAGVSIGAYIGLMMVSGYKSQDIIEDGLVIDLFHDISSLSLPDLWSRQEFLTKHGIFSTAPIRHRLEFRLKEKFGLVPTLHQLFLATGIELMTTTMELNTGVQYLSHRTNPNLSCIDAVLNSINIPLAFEKIQNGSKIYIDGAFGNPYPVDQYDNGTNQILGILIMNKTIEIESETRNIKTLLQYLFRCLNSPIHTIRDHNLQHASSNCRHLILEWPAMYDPLGLTQSEATKASMIIEGYRRAQKFILGEIKEKIE